MFGERGGGSPASCPRTHQHRTAAGADLPALDGVEGVRTGALRLPEQLEDVDVERREVLDDLPSQGRWGVMVGSGSANQRTSSERRRKSSQSANQQRASEGSQEGDTKRPAPIRQSDAGGARQTCAE